MVKKNGEILQNIFQTVTETSVTLKNLCETVKTHNEILNGDPQQMGKGGVVATIKEHEAELDDQKKTMSGIKRSVDKYRSTDATKVHGINLVISAVVTGIMNWVAVHFNWGRS